MGFNTLGGNVLCPTAVTPDPVESNIDAIVKMEQEFLSQRSRADRIADAVGDFAGSMGFVILHAVWFGGWILLNTGNVLGIRPFDRFPFMFLTFTVSLEAIFLSTFVLMKQNRMGRQADRRAHLDLQINLLAERESTEILRILAHIHDRMRLDVHGEDVEKLAQQTDLKKLAGDLAQRLPEK